MDSIFYKSTRMVLMITALIQLAVSQIHIEAITKLFVRDVGFFLFIFVITGLLVLFNLTSMGETTAGNLGMFSIMTVAAVTSGCVYMYKVWTDYVTQTAVVWKDIQLTFIITAVVIAVYLIGGMIVIVKGLANR